MIFHVVASLAVTRHMYNEQLRSFRFYTSVLPTHTLNYSEIPLRKGELNYFLLFASFLTRKLKICVSFKLQYLKWLVITDCGFPPFFSNSNTVKVPDTVPRSRQNYCHSITKKTCQLLSFHYQVNVPTTVIPIPRKRANYRHSNTK